MALPGDGGQDLLDRCLDDARRIYGSLEHPNFLLIGRAIDDNPYQELIGDIAELVRVKDLTDENSDFGFCLSLGQRGGEWLLQLSVVGGYAMLLRLARPWPSWFSTPVVEVVHEPAAGTEQAITALLRDAGFTLLTREQAEITVPFAGPSDTEPVPGPLYRILFRDVSDVAELSWRCHA